MANVFKPKRSGTASSIPTISDLIDGELAVNSADQKIYLRDGSNIIEVGNVSSGGGGISDVVEDTTPQLGGDLDLNSSDITGTGNVNITGTITSSGDIQTDGAFRAESSNSTERFEIEYNETTDSLDFSYFSS